MTLSNQDGWTLSDWANLASISASIAAILGLIEAFVAALIAWKALMVDREMQREAMAKQIYSEMLQTAVRYPKYAEPDGLGSFTKEELVGYRWFVSVAFNACEELLIHSNEIHWKREVELFARIHKEYLKSSKFETEDRDSYRSILLDIIDRVLSEDKGA